jgi:hypothetical protein
LAVWWIVKMGMLGMVGWSEVGREGKWIDKRDVVAER